MKQVTGLIKRHPDGFGFLVVDNSEVPDLYISKRDMQGVMTNDRVSAAVVREPGGKRFRGEDLKIISRSTKGVIGQYMPLSDEGGLLQDKSLSWGEDLFVSYPRDLKIKPGEWVHVEIKTYPGSDEGFTGVVKAVIGDVSDPQNDDKRMLLVHNIPNVFSQATLNEAEALPDEVRDSDMKNRKDLRELKFITIDGQTAKDFDDAILVETGHQGMTLYVAIADVSHYVKPGTAIDEDAYERGTSTYFPNFVSPMLPEKLSNGLCSLKPNVPRLAFVAEMHLNFNGDMISSDFYEAVIESKSRVTYGEAQEVIEGRVPEKHEHVKDEILRARDLAKILMAKRFRDGSLDLEIPETVVELDSTGQPVDIIKSERLFAHRLIEELMLMANVAVAKVFTARETPTLYRIHESPNEEDIEKLESFMSNFEGSKISLSGGKLQKKLTRALEAFGNRPEKTVLNILTLRSMMQAKYSPHNVGHFGLGFSDYAHFTSPIRRYPDLIVHRTLKALLDLGRGYMPMDLDQLETAGTMLSACEQRSTKAERQIHSIKRARFMERHVGESFEGMITSVTKFGVFVTLRAFDIDGLIRLQDLSSDRLDFDEDLLRLVAQRSGMTYSIGDVLAVQVAGVNVQEGQIDFVLDGVGESKSGIAAKGTFNREKKDEASGFKRSFKSIGKNDKKKQDFEKRRPSKDDNNGVRKKRFSKPRRKK